MSKNTLGRVKAATTVALTGALVACGGGGGGASVLTIEGASLIANESTPAANDFRGLSFGPSGAVFASGFTDADATDRMTVVAKYNADGTLDTSFGGDGIVELNLSDVGGADEGSLGVVALAGGDVIVVSNVTDAGGVGQSVQLARLDAVGNLVNSFGTNGVAEVVFGWASADDAQWPNAGEAPEDTAFDLQLDSQERLVVFGYGPAAYANGGAQRTDRDRYVARINATTGAVDASFNGGVAHTYNTTGDGTDNARRGIVLADDSILASGYTNFGGAERHHVILVKLTSAGALDASFVGFGNAPGGASEDGVAIFNPFIVDGGYSECYGVAQQADGSFVTTGYGGATGTGITSSLGYETTQAQDVVAFRVPLLGGAIDNSWGNSGTQAIQSEADTGTPSFEDRGRHIISLADDRTVHVGRYGGDAALFVMTADGQLDTTVSGDGIIVLPDSVIESQFYAVAANGNTFAATTNNDIDGARLVIIELD